jgi:hypothetical protein
MSVRDHFEPSRFWALLRLEVLRHLKGIGMAFVITFGLLFVLGLLLSLAVEGDIKIFRHEENYAASLLIGGFVLSSLAFDDLADPLRRSRYLTLPAAAFEKLLVMWLLTCVGWVILFSVTYTLYSYVANPIAKLLFDHVTFEAFNPFDAIVPETIKYYVVLQAIFLMGAAHFRGYVLPKTIFTIVLIAVVIGALLYFSLSDIFLSDHDCDGNHCELVDQVGLHSVWTMTKFTFWWLLAPTCWVLTFLGLKEQEV